MALVTKTPGTPVTSAPPPAVVAPSPGTWRHPKFNEITRRQQAFTFDERNIKTILWNGGALLARWPLGSFVESYPSLQNGLLTPLSCLGPYPLWTIRNLWSYIIPLILLYNIYTALSPLFRSKDDLADIPLTPSQRSLLGLDPNASLPATPDTQYITPPRYPRSVTPRSGTPGSRSSSAAGSPISRKGSPLALGRQASDSSFSPSASPLWQKAIGGSKETRRHSYGLPSPLGLGVMGKDVSVFSMPSTPSPTAGKGPSVALNSRWLYERGRSFSGSRSMYSG